MKSEYIKKLYEALNDTSDDVRKELIATSVNKKLESVLGINADIDVAIDQNDIIVDVIDDNNNLHLILGFSHDQFGDLLIISPYDIDLNNVADDMAGIVELSQFNPPKILHNGVEILDITNLDWLPDAAIINALPSDLTTNQSNESIKLIKNKQKLTFSLNTLKSNWSTTYYNKPIKVGYKRVNNNGKTAYEKMNSNMLGALKNLPIISYRAVHLNNK